MSDEVDAKSKDLGGIPQSAIGRPKLLIALTGFLFPGLGHYLLGKRNRAAIFFCVLSCLFFVGVFLEREFYTKFGAGLFPRVRHQVQSLMSGAGAAPPDELAPRETHDELEGFVDKAWKVIFIYAYPFFVGVGNYAIGAKWSDWTGPYITRVPGVLKADEVPVTVRDIGYCFALLSGLLNLLVMMDAYDIACNEEELARRARPS
jgi:hypothetical protein